MKLLGRRRVESRLQQRAEPFMIAAASASRRVRHDYIGTEHLLLALAEDRDSAAARILAANGLSADRVHAEIMTAVGACERPRGPLDRDALATLGIDLDEVRRRAERSFGPGALEHTAAGCTPVMPRLKRALELAARDAEHSPISPEDVLLGLASVKDCVASQILAAHGITMTTLRSTGTREPPGQPST